MSSESTTSIEEPNVEKPQVFNTGVANEATPNHKVEGVLRLINRAFILLLLLTLCGIEVTVQEPGLRFCCKQCLHLFKIRCMLSYCSSLQSATLVHMMNVMFQYSMSDSHKFKTAM